MVLNDPKDATHSAVVQWTADLTEALNLSHITIDVDEVLALAGEAAHALVRPAAPVTTFIVGYAVGRAVEAGQLTFDSAFALSRELVAQLLATRAIVG